MVSLADHLNSGFHFQENDCNILLLFSICKVSKRGVSPDSNKKGVRKKEAREANETLFLVTSYRRKLRATHKPNTLIKGDLHWTQDVLST